MGAERLEDGTDYLNVWHLRKIQEIRCRALLWCQVMTRWSPSHMTKEEPSASTVDQAVLMFTLGEEEKAQSLLVEYLNSNDQDLDAWRALSEIRLTGQDFPGAEEACRRALAIDANDLTSTVSLARILVAQGDKDGAEEASAKARILGWKDELAQDEDSA